jgi:NHLM bacteriocin system ABC transporter ATP-binding protein
MPPDTEADEEGVLFEIDGNAPLVLNDPERIWMIGSGAVDVFASHVTDGEPDGTRIHLFRATSPQILFGIRPNPLRMDMALLAVGLPGTRLVTLSRARLIRLTEVLGFSGEALNWIDTWVRQLSTAISRLMVPPRHVVLEPTGTIELAEDEVACCTKGSVWVRQLEGSLQFMDRIELVVTAGDEFFPVPQQAWVRARAASRLTVVDTDTWLRRDPDWSSLEAFHDAVLQCVIWNTDESVRAERARLRQKSAIERRAMQQAVARLASVLAPTAEAELARRGGMRHERAEPLVEACRLVVTPLGISPGSAAVDSVSLIRSADAVQEIARAWRIRMRKVVLREGWWRRDHGPILGFVDGPSADQRRPVALLPVAPHRYELVDPAEGTRTPVTAPVAASLAFFGYCCYRPLRARALSVRRLLQFGLKGCGRELVAVALTSVLGGLMMLATPIATGLIFDAVIPGSHRDQLFQLAGALLVAAIGMMMFQLTRSLAMLRIDGRMGASILAGVWDRLVSLPVGFFRKYSSGDLTNRAMGIDEIRRVLTSAILSSIVAGAFALLSFALLLAIDVRLAFLAGLLLLINFVVSVGAGYAQLRFQQRYYDVAGRIAGMVLEFVTGIAKLRAAGAEHRAFAVWAQSFADQKRIALASRSIGNGLAVFNSVFPIAISLLLFGVVSRYGGQAPSGTLSLSTGAFLAFYAALGQCASAVLDLSEDARAVLRTMPLYERTRPILEAEPEADVARADPGELSGAIEISHVSFRYRHDGPLILDDIGMPIKPGEFVALVGPSGAGKSTILRLLLGFEAPESGAIYYDGRDLAGLDRQAVRRQIGVVLQSGKLIPGDVLSNIIGSSALTIDDAWEAARRAGLDEDIKAMPMGMHTIIGEGGTTLSGGQRQRLMIARAIVSRPRVLLFDEATSALDNRTQAIVSRSLEELQATRIVIAHRLSTIRHADQICVVAGGRIVQRGTYADLMHERGPFALLARRQLA